MGDTERVIERKRKTKRQRDREIITIRYFQAERVKFFLHEAKYGKLCANDPFMALKRDSIMAEEVKKTETPETETI